MSSFLTSRRLRGGLTGVAVAAMVLTTAACGGTTRGEEDTSGSGSENTASANPDAEIPEGLKIAFLPKQLNNPYFAVADGGGEKAVGELKGEYSEVGPSEASASSQVSYINTLTQQGADVIVTSANDPNAICSALDQARAGGAKVVILSATANATNQNAWIETMKSYAAEKYPQLQIVSTVYGDDEDEKSFQETQGLLQSTPDLKGIISPTTVGIAAAARYLSGSEYKGKVALTGLGTPNQMRDFVKDGTVTSFALWNPEELGYLAAYAGAALPPAKITGAEGEKFTAGAWATTPSRR